MYEPRSLFLLSEVKAVEQSSVYVPVYSNGTYIRTETGRIVGRDDGGRARCFSSTPF